MKLTKLVMASLAAVLVSGVAFADMPAKEEFKETIPVAQPEPVVVEPACGWGYRLHAGVPIWFFKDEDSAATGGVYMDAFPCELPINLRVGAEVRHLGFDSKEAMYYAETGEDKAHITYVRIPISVEYMVELVEQTTLYLSIGPDLVSTANDVSDFTVGMHLGLRLMYEFENNVSVSLDSGYMWAQVKDGGPDVSLDGAYLIPTLGYRF